MKTKPLIAGVLLIAAIIAVGLGLWQWKHRGAAQQQGGGMPPETVDIVAATADTWQPTARLVGTIVAKRSITLSNEIVGVVTAVGFESGAVVEPGQVLVKFDTATEEADLASARAAEQLAQAAIHVAEADIRVAESNVQWAQSNQARYQSAGNSVSASDADRARVEFDKAQSTLERQKSVLQQSRAEADQAAAKARQIETLIAKKTLKAPFRARVGMRNVHEGQYLAEGTTIASLTELTDDIYLDFAIPQEYTALVKAGAEVLAKSVILGGEGVKIQVLSMDATVNPTTRNVRVRTSIRNPGFALKPGMSVDVEVPVGPARSVVTVPSTVIRRAAFGDHVFVLLPGDGKGPPGSFTASQRMVTLGANLGDRLIVETGLKDGDLVAGNGSFKLREGATVMRAPPPAAKPPAGAPPAATPPTAAPESDKQAAVAR